jgi:hypothetical protein
LFSGAVAARVDLLIDARLTMVCSLHARLVSASGGVVFDAAIADGRARVFCRYD